MADAIRIFGYHGTTADATVAILREGFTISYNPYDWLGRGIYFFQDAPIRAWCFARDNHPGVKVAVIKATILLEDCMDLVDPLLWWKFLREGHRLYKARCELDGKPMARQSIRGYHGIDREVIDITASVTGKRIVRGIFEEGNRIYPKSAFRHLSHIQVAVRDTALIESPISLEPERDNLQALLPQQRTNTPIFRRRR